MTNPERIAQICKVLSVPTRVRIIQFLRGQPRCVNAVAHHLHITPAAASQHLRVLRDADMVTADKRGYFVHYRLNSDTLGEWSRLTDHFFHRQDASPRSGTSSPDGTCGVQTPCPARQKESQP